VLGGHDDCQGGGERVLHRKAFAEELRVPGQQREWLRIGDEAGKTSRCATGTVDFPTTRIPGARRGDSAAPAAFTYVMSAAFSPSF